MCLKIDVRKDWTKMAVCRLSLKLAWQTDWNDTHQNNFLQYFQINIFTTSVFWNQYFLSLNTSTNIQMAGYRCIPRYRCQRHRFLFVWPFMSGVPRIGSRKSWGIIIDKCFPQISAVLVNIPPPIWETVKVWLGEDLKLKTPRSPKILIFIQVFCGYFQ